MQRVAYMIKVRTENLEQYKEEHAGIPPELTTELKTAGVCNCSLWMGPDGLVFGYLECENWENTSDYLSQSQVNRDWQMRMHPFQEPTPGASSDDMWIRMLEMVCVME